MNSRALLIVDVQNDFITGSLAVPGSEKIIPLINDLQNHFDVVIASKDWHPENHCSFAKVHKKAPGDEVTVHGKKQTLWPNHCVQNTYGSEFHSALSTEKIEKVFYKGADEKRDSYSAFYDNDRLFSTGLTEYLKRKGIETIVIVGLTTEYCVKFSAIDAITEGFKPIVIIDACRGVELHEGDVKEALIEMKDAGVWIMTLSEYFKEASR